MTLKDANGFNVQFLEGKPIFIDTLSFDKYKHGNGWIGYRQFCMFFLGPLLLMSKVDLRSNRFLQLFIDGLPLDFVSSMLPKSSWLNFGALLNIHMHSRSEKKFSQVVLSKQKKSVSVNSILGLIDNLEGLISKLRIKQTKTTWGDYYNNTNYTPKAFKSKKSITSRFLDLSKPNKVWDFGANNGTFSRLVKSNSQVISFDNDPLAIDQNYNYNKEQKIKNCLPLIMDLTNVTPSIGWNLKERLSLIDRGPTDLVIFLALIHHLVISNNLSFELIANFLGRITKKLIIEFVPKTDSQVEKLVKNREDIFLEYNPVQFEKSFSEKFKIIALQKVADSKRVIYLMETKND